ncbi:hypothetical protein [Kitasatospora sp. NPDC001132]
MTPLNRLLRGGDTPAVQDPVRGLGPVGSRPSYDTLTVHMLDKVLREETARLGLWIDTSLQTPAETVDEIVARAWTEARIGEPPA